MRRPGDAAGSRLGKLLHTLIRGGAAAAPQQCTRGQYEVHPNFMTNTSAKQTFFSRVTSAP
jgi:hypothetical protein